MSAGTDTSWDRQALTAGIATAVVIGLAATGIGVALPNDSPWRAVMVAVTMLGFVLGSAMAAWAQRRGTPFHHGVVAAVAAYLLVEAVFVVVALARGRSVRILGLLLKLTLVVGAGVVGGVLGGVLRRRGFVPAHEHRTAEREP